MRGRGGNFSFPLLLFGICAWYYLRLEWRLAQPEIPFIGNGYLHPGHRKRMRSYSKKIKVEVCALLLAVGMSAGCISVKKESKAPTLLKTDTATQAQLMGEVNRFARVNSMRAKMDLKFEDNSFAEFGSKEVYRQADGEVVVQRPAKILLKVQVPIIKSDVAQMTSDGDTFRVAILQDGGTGKYKKFVKGTNSADYSSLQRTLSKADLEAAKAMKENVNAFANLRPQHFTDAMLVRPTDDNHLYTQSPIYQDEDDPTAQKKSPIRSVTRGYYLLDEYAHQETGLKVTRRFWFDRVGGIRLARQQIFGTDGEIESDILYGREVKLTETGEYLMPVEITVTRPKEHYSMKLTYQTPEAVTIGKQYPDAAFVLQNSWNLEEVDLDQKLGEARNNPQPSSQVNSSGNPFRQQFK